MSKISIAILGFGQRGKVFADVSDSVKNDMEFVACCDTNKDKNHDIEKTLNISKDMIFNDYNEFVKAGKLADVLIVSTMDKDHYHHAMNALSLGYHLLLEKPIALTKKEIFNIKEKANLLNLKIAVAHVLRYTVFYEEIKKIIDAGKIGSIMTMHQSENVGYHHFAHSYVRGNWHNSKLSSPMILAKSSHDLDILRFLKQKRVSKISSFGNLSYFKKENMPKNAAKNCIDCKLDCIFNAIDFYKDNPSWMAFFSTETDVEKVLSDRTLDYGKCVYQMDNDVCDQQMLNMEFEDGTTASLTTTAFSKETHRMIEIKGSKGEIVGDLDDNVIHFKPYGKDDEIIHIEKLTNDFSYHSGGDRRLFADFILALKNNTSFNTDINDSLESHYLAFDAERSRLNGGQVVDTTTNWKDYNKHV
jgi:predicted dehydrogenase